MAAFKYLLFILLFILKSFDDVGGDCVLSVQNDFGSPSPVFIRKNTFLAPNDSGSIYLKKDEAITVACPGTNRVIVLGNLTTTSNVLDAYCVKSLAFRVDGWRGSFGDIRCNGQPHYTTQATDKRCYRPRHGRNNVTMYRVGYQVKSLFHSLYESCFDAAQLSTSYVQHTLTPQSLFMQQGFKRPQFIEGDLFGKVKMSNIYKFENQKHRFDAVLGNNMSDKYITKKQFLSRGHLAARADFTLQAESRASFHYVNAAPQWQRGNAGDWAALEDALRRRVQTLGRSIIVRTGTHKVLRLLDKHNQPQEIYLHADENNNLLVPVPLYFYKVAYDPKSKTATVFVLINSTFYNATTIEKLTFCDDVCEDNPKFSWLKWRSNDGTFSFCCDYEQFTNEVDYLDRQDVKGLFY